jgi:hypothetical protein
MALGCHLIWASTSSAVELIEPHLLPGAFGPIPDVQLLNR